MYRYLVTYDLVGTDETSDDYRRIIGEIETYEHIKVQKSVWLINTALSAKEVHDFLWPYMDDNDRLLISPVTRGSWWHNTLCGTAALEAFLAD